MAEKSGNSKAKDVLSGEKTQFPFQFQVYALFVVDLKKCSV
jgi:hypothetical protein